MRSDLDERVHRRLLDAADAALAEDPPLAAPRPSRSLVGVLCHAV